MTTGAARQQLLHDLSRDELTAQCAAWGESAYRAAQVWRWLYVQWADQWARMTNLPAILRQRLRESFSLEAARLEQVQDAPSGTRKLLVALSDSEAVETVIIPAGGRQTVCLSSQAGCRWRCAFCASGQAGLRRSLSAGEMVGQTLLVTRLLGARPDNVVFMGMGEPLDNYDAVLKAVRILNDPAGLGIGARRITLSTSGVIPGITRLADEHLQVELSVSLHAADDALRSQLMPVNRVYPLAELIGACRAYTEATGRIVTMEYTLIRGLNDAPAQAEALAELLRPLKCRVNLIPLSPVDEYDGQTPAPETIRAFERVLIRRRLPVTVRASKGGEIRAACGQLRLRHRGKNG